MNLGIIMGIMLIGAGVAMAGGMGGEASLGDVTATGSPLGWHEVSSSGVEAQLEFWTSSTDKKTELGWIPPNEDCLGWEDRFIYDENNNQVLDDKDKEILLKCESSKCDGQNCYYISLTEEQAININRYIKLGENSFIVEYPAKIIYNFDWGQTNITLLQEGVQVEDVFVYAKEDGKGWTFGADGSHADMKNYSYIIESSDIIHNIPNGDNIPKFYHYYNEGITWNEKRHFIDFKGLCDLESNCSYEFDGNNKVTIDFIHNGTIKTDSITNVSSCQTLIIQGETYTLNQSITDVSTDCILIGNQSITFDMNGYNISGVTTKDADATAIRFQFIVTASINNVTISNGSIFDFKQGMEFVPISPPFMTGIKVLNVSVVAEDMNITTYIGGAGAYTLARIEGIVLQNCVSCIIDNVRINLSQIGVTPNPPNTLGGGVRGIGISGGVGEGDNITNILMENLINKASVTDSEGILIDIIEHNHYFENITIGTGINGMGDFGSKGLKILGYNINFKNINIVSTEYGAYLGGGLPKSENVSFQDGIITGGLSDNDVYFFGFAPPFPPNQPKQVPLNTTFINVSFDSVGVIATGNPTWSRHWYYSALVNNTNNVGISGVDIVGYDNRQVLLFNQTSDANGLIPLQTIKEFNATALNKEYWTPHTFNSSSPLCSEVGKSVNFTARQPIGYNLYEQPFEICSCYLASTGNSFVECSDNCTWVDDITLNGNLTMNGTGKLIQDADFYLNTTEIFFLREDTCEYHRSGEII